MTSPVETSFQAGQAAFDTENYPAAIAHLEAVVRDDCDPALLTAAYQTLIVAYTKGDRPRDALDLCKRLSQDPQSYPCAAKALADLTRRFRQANAAALTTAPDSDPPPSARERRPLPMAYAAPPEVAPAVFVSGREWRNAERAKTWKKLKPPRRWKFWLRLLGTAIAFFALLRWSILLSFALIQGVMLSGLRLPPPAWLYAEPSPVILSLLAVIFVATPWLLDLLLKQRVKAQTWGIYSLASQYPESSKLLQRLAQDHHIPLPKLLRLPIAAPVILTYGPLPRTTRIAISDGLLACLEDEELATLLAAQMATIIHRDVGMMSGAIAWLHLPFLLYEGFAWGGGWLQEWIAALTQLPPKLRQGLSTIVTMAAASLAALSYGCYWLWRVPLLYFSRQRHYYGDRFSAEATGNPNAMSRALLKISLAISRHIEQQESTFWLLESADLLMPVGHRQALSLGSLPDKTPFAEVLTWECVNPYRHWLALMNSHPLMGDRLYLLNRYANYWSLPPEIDIPTVIPPPQTWRQHLEKFANSYRALPILQSAVLSGLFFGIVSRSILWIIGVSADLLSDWFPLWRLIWLANARSFLDGCILIAFSLSLIVWINGYFPNIRVSPSRQNPRLEDLMRDPKTVPPKSYGVQLEGILLGRRGLINWLGQDLILKTSSGLLKLHFIAKAGPLGNLWPIPPRPVEFVGQKVTVLGWLRRGSTVWVDVDVLRSGGRQTRSGYPVWVTVLAIAAALWGAWVIWQA